MTALTHLIADPADRVTICGQKLAHGGRTNRNAYPNVLARHARAHTAGRGITVCPECSARRRKIADLAPSRIRQDRNERLTA